jgi:hypothetical protein
MKLNKTDQTFKDHLPEYYHFDEHEWDEKICVREGCYKKFRGRLELLRFCSRGCMELFLSSFKLGVIKGTKL